MWSKALASLLLISGPLSARAVCQEVSTLEERIVVVDGLEVQIWTGGPDRSPGTPLVVFENGWQGTARIWTRAAPEVATTAPVLLYNRGGRGRSQPDGEIPTIEHVGQRLRALLEALDAPPPYLLVGHSAGGPYVRGFAAMYPESVEGIAYVDPSSPCVLETAFERVGAPEMASVFMEAPDPGGVNPIDVLGKLELGALELPPIPVTLLIGLDSPVPPGPAAILRERGIDPEQLSAESRRAKIPCLAPYALESPNGELIATPRSGHNIPMDEPELVISAVRRLLERSTTEPAVPEPPRTRRR